MLEVIIDLIAVKIHRYSSLAIVLLPAFILEIINPSVHGPFELAFESFSNSLNTPLQKFISSTLSFQLKYPSLKVAFH